MHIEFKEINRILEFIIRSIWDLMAEYHLNKEDIIVSIPEYFFYFLKNKMEVHNFKEDISGFYICGVKMQYNHENYISIFCPKRHTELRGIPIYKTGIKTSINFFRDEEVEDSLPSPSEIRELNEQLETTYKSAVFWEREYNREKSKKWYHKLFGI